jgi:hypothetical protein
MNCELGTIGATVYVDQAAGIIESQDFKIIFQYHPLFSTGRDQTHYRKLASAGRDISASATGHPDAASRPRWAGGERTALINQLRQFSRSKARSSHGGGAISNASSMRCFAKKMVSQ